MSDNEEQQEIVQQENVQQQDIVQQNEPKVVTKKDPFRVEQGKKLAAISKEAKEKKMRRKIEEEMRNEKSLAGEILFHIVTPLSLGIAAFLFGLWMSMPKEENLEQQQQQETPLVPEEPKKKEKKKTFESLD